MRNMFFTNLKALNTSGVEVFSLLSMTCTAKPFIERTSDHWTKIVVYTASSSLGSLEIADFTNLRSKSNFDQQKWNY